MNTIEAQLRACKKFGLHRNGFSNGYAILAGFAPCCEGSNSFVRTVAKDVCTATAAWRIAIAERAVMVGERVGGRNGLKTFTFEKIV